MNRSMIIPAVLLAAASLAMPAHAQSGLMNTVKGSSADGIDFGDNSSSFANNDLCDDPRFEGEGMTSFIIESDRMHDANDCRAAYKAGTVRLVQTSSSSGSINFGDDSSMWSNDGECDDPRFEGPGAAETLLDEDRFSDATDCRKAFNAGEIWLAGTGSTSYSSEFAINFGNDSSTWANDGECDDPRFGGSDAAATLLESDRMADASDCRAGLEAGTLYVKTDGVNFGNDSSTWANDGECDDPRFSGPGAAATLLDSDRMADATDCRAEFRAGRIVLAGASGGGSGGETFTSPFVDSLVFGDIDFGDDASEWAFDGECDDPRFEGEASALFNLDEDMYHDATDCREAYEAGNVYLKD